jgi:hypothetical protein
VVWFGVLEKDTKKEPTMLNTNLNAVRLSRVLSAAAAGSLALLMIAGFYF